MKTIKADVAVIGAGMIGCCIAYNTAKRGLETVILEKDAVGCGASARSTGAVRQQGRKPCDIPLALEATKMYQNLSRELEYDIEYRRHGNIYLAYSGEHMAKLSEMVRQQENVGFYGSKLVSTKKIHDLVPRLSNGIVGGMYSSTDGHVNPIYLTYALARKAKQIGAKIYTHSPVKQITTHNNRVWAVITDALEVKTEWVVNAAGVFSRDVSNLLGIDIPVLPITADTIVTEPIPPFCRPFVRCTEKMFAFRQTINGNLQFASADFARVTGSMEITLKSFLSLVSKMVKVLPGSKHISIIRSWAGLRTVTPDALQIIGKVERPAGYVLATGFSGHGLATCPAVGKAVAEIILEGKGSTVDLQEFNVARFKHTDFEEFKKAVTPSFIHETV